MAPPARIPVLVRRRGGLDKYGNPLPDPDPHVIHIFGYSPRTQGAGASSKGIEDRGRQGVIEGLTLYAPPNPDVRQTDLLEIDGDRFEVEGEMGEWFNPYTRRHAGVEINVRRAEG